jgi:hypothetical protein
MDWSRINRASDRSVGSEYGPVPDARLEKRTGSAFFNNLQDRRTPMKIHSMLAALILTAAIPASAEAPAEPAADAAARELPITTMTCRQLLQAGGESRDLLLALFHGYMAGKNGATRLDTVDMSFATDAVIDHCIDKPADPVLAAFAAAGKDGR